MSTSRSVDEKLKNKTRHACSEDNLAILFWYIILVNLDEIYVTQI